MHGGKGIEHELRKEEIRLSDRREDLITWRGRAETDSQLLSGRTFIVAYARLNFIHLLVRQNITLRGVAGFKLR